MAAINFDATTVTPNASFDPLPAGWYNANITASEMKPTKDGSGAYIQLELTILDGDHANRKVFDRLNVQNNSQVAQEIAYATLSSICHATGVIQVQDTSQLHGIPLEVKLSVRAASGDYEANNDVKGYRASSAGGGSARPPVTSQPPAMTPPAQTPPAQTQPQGNAGWGQPPAQQAPQENPAWSQPPANHQVPPQTQEQPPVQNQAPAWGQPAQQAQPQAQQQPEQMQTSGQPWAGTASPTQGNTPSADGVAGTPPWAQPQ